MKLFVSYPSTHRDLAEQLRLALEQEGHTVFTDRAELKEGEGYHEALREAIDDADGLVFLVTPRAVAPGSYALTELDLAQRQWRSPAGRVLPVLVEPTPIASIPPYLRAVTLLHPKGDLVAETVAAVDRLHGGSRLHVWLGTAAGLAVLAGAGLWWWHQTTLERERNAALQAALKAEIAVSAQLCEVALALERSAARRRWPWPARRSAPAPPRRACRQGHDSWRQSVAPTGRPWHRIGPLSPRTNSRLPKVSH